MIQIDDDAIILSTRKHAENSTVLQMLTRNHGVYHGVVRYGATSRMRGIIQPGNIVHAQWSARLEEHMGTIKAEMKHGLAAAIMADGLGLAALASLCALLRTTLPERHAYPKLYDAATAMLTQLATQPASQCMKAYAQFELLLLSECGFGLDLSSCAATGATEDLIYVSPKSGRAVSRQAGEPYKDKMLNLPAFFVSNPPPLPHHPILDAFTLTGYFLEHWLMESLHKKMPQARERLIKML